MRKKSKNPSLSNSIFLYLSHLSLFFSFSPFLRNYSLLLLIQIYQWFYLVFIYLCFHSRVWFRNDRIHVSLYIQYKYHMRAYIPMYGDRILGAFTHLSVLLLEGWGWGENGNIEKKTFQKY